jgi:hypothetical protein
MPDVDKGLKWELFLYGGIGLGLIGVFGFGIYRLSQLAKSLPKAPHIPDPVAALKEIWQDAETEATTPAPNMNAGDPAPTAGWWDILKKVGAEIITGNVPDLPPEQNPRDAPGFNTGGQVPDLSTPDTNVAPIPDASQTTPLGTPDYASGIGSPDTAAQTAAGG